MRIVVVEDEATIRRGLEKIIGKLGSSYILEGTASDGKEGLSLIERTNPDLVIMDIHMPVMDGLTMLECVRDKGLDCKAVVLTAYSEFQYAQKAIELGIENYLLKPIKIPDLKKTLEQVEAKIKKEESGKTMDTLEDFFLKAITGGTDLIAEEKKMLQTEYDFDVDKPVYVYVVSISKEYLQQRKTVAEKIEKELEKLEGDNLYYRLDFASRDFCVYVFYRYENKDALMRFLRKTTFDIQTEHGLKDMICAVKTIENVEGMHQDLREIENGLDWNLLLGNEVLIDMDRINELQFVPLNYPREIENRARQALLNRQPMQFDQCVEEFCEQCTNQLYGPKHIKEACIRFCINILGMAKRYGYYDGQANDIILQNITKALTWDDIRENLKSLFRRLVAQPEQDATSGLLVKRATELIHEEYQNGLTLDELAARLYVSEEYLSTLFKKETGKTFTETIREVRILKVKDLLTTTTLKLNQIAELAGYSDPKYMSKVFKEEVGILPAEYRKIHTH